MLKLLKRLNQKTVIYIDLDNMISGLVGNDDMLSSSFNQHFLEYINELAKTYCEGKVIVNAYGYLQHHNLNRFVGSHKLECCELNIINTPVLSDTKHTDADYLLIEKINMDEKCGVNNMVLVTSDVDFMHVCQRLKNSRSVSLLSFGYHAKELADSVSQVLDPDLFIRKLPDFNSRIKARRLLDSELSKGRLSMSFARRLFNKYKADNTMPLRKFLLSLNPKELTYVPKGPGYITYSQ